PHPSAVHSRTPELQLRSDPTALRRSYRIAGIRPRTQLRHRPLPRKQSPFLARSLSASGPGPSRNRRRNMGPALESPPCGPAEKTVSVCICTFRRPEMLRRLLLELDGQAGSFSVLIIDNDPSASARPIVESLYGLLSYDLRYVLETERNISAARNRAL